MKHSDEAYDAIRREIVDGTFRAGHRLVEADLVATLGTGRSYVRDALARLQTEGLVEKEAGKSSVVRHVPTAELLEILDARIALEAIVARAAAERRTRLQAARLNALVDELTGRAEAGDVIGVMACQADFHHELLEASGQPAIGRIIANLTALTARTRMHTMMLPGRVAASARDHRAIASAVVSGDGEAAARSMSAHLGWVRSAVARMPDAAVQGRPRRR